jgi:D-alanyl-D-alanine carboxypeptidase
MKKVRLLSLFFLITLAVSPLTAGCGGSGSLDAVVNPPVRERPEPPYDWADPGLPARLEAAMDGWARDFGYNGAAVAVYTPDWFSWVSGCGEADIEAHVPFRADDPGRIASATKSFTATVTLQLVDEGLLSLDSTLGEFVPDYPNGENITVEHLLRHRSGIPEIQLVDAYFIASIILFQSHWFTPEEILLWTYLPPPFPPILNMHTGEETPRQPLTEPGGDYNYSQPGYVALGLIAEKLTGKELADVYAERILRPLGLTGTHLPRMDDSVEPGGYTNLFGLLDEKVPGGSILTVSANTFHSAGWSAGGIISTARDLTVFLSAMLEGRLFSQARLENATDWMQTRPDGGNYGMGLYQSLYDDFFTVGHNGALPGGGSVNQYIPELDVYVGAVMNTDADWKELPDLVERVRGALLNEAPGTG